MWWGLWKGCPFPLGSCQQALPRSHPPPPPALGIRRCADCLQKWARWSPGWGPDAEVAGLGGGGGASDMPERRPGARAPCPVLSWQLALGAGRAPPVQARAGQAGSVSGQGGETANGASLGLVWSRCRLEGQWSLLGELIPCVRGAVCLHPHSYCMCV